ncbi:hypothetical protein G9464_15525 [Halostella sp. JP-L12]|uniref:hypothetical protein n=1 Tax=Halostella TaxID=1843185 RepID=UPI000EF7C02F|nr:MULTISPECIES: hypothetical protein [Halostella]NHN48993.1 hypothetical protein [Halostella sp. JP-L12]
MTVPLAPLHAGHGDPVPNALLGVTFGASLAVGFLAVLADRDSAANYVAGAVIAFLTAFAVVERTPHTNLLADVPLVAALALAVPAVHLAVAARRSSARIGFLAVLYAGPVALVAYLIG